MKIIGCFAMMVAFTASVVAAPQGVVVQAQIVEVAMNGAGLPKDLSRLAERKGADVLTAPALKTVSGKPTTLSVTRDFAVPGKGTFVTGVVLTVRPTLVGDRRVRYLVDFELTEFEGFAVRSSSKAPMFSTRRTVGIEGVTELGKSVVLDLCTRHDSQMVKDPGQPRRTAVVYRRVFAVLNFSKVAE